jgi:hypothetical protein
LIAPPGTVWPAGNFENQACSYTLTDTTTSDESFSCPSVGLAEGGAAVTVTVPNLIGGDNQLSLVVTDVTNPPAGSAGGSQTLSVSTSTDTTPVVSQTYTVSGSPTGSTAVTSASVSDRASSTSSPRPEPSSSPVLTAAGVVTPPTPSPTTPMRRGAVREALWPAPGPATASLAAAATS